MMIINLEEIPAHFQRLYESNKYTRGDEFISLTRVQGDSVSSPLFCRVFIPFLRPSSESSGIIIIAKIPPGSSSGCLFLHGKKDKRNHHSRQTDTTTEE